MYVTWMRYGCIPLLQAAESLRSQWQRIGEKLDRLVIAQHGGVHRDKLYTVVRQVSFTLLCACARVRMCARARVSFVRLRVDTLRLRPNTTRGAGAGTNLLQRFGKGLPPCLAARRLLLLNFVPSFICFPFCPRPPFSFRARVCGHGNVFKLKHSQLQDKVGGFQKIRGPKQCEVRRRRRRCALCSRGSLCPNLKERYR